MITFSIVTITYNADNVLGKTVDSVFSQTYPHVEHVIIDGASTDDTLQVAQDYMQRSYAASNGHEIRIVSEPDNGLYDAMNKGLRQVSGDYVLFLNAGDFFPDSEVLSNIARNVGLEGVSREKLPVVLYGNTDIVDNDGRFLRHRRLQPPANLSWRSFRHGMLVCHQAFYARLDIAKTVPYDCRYRFSADVDWCIRIMKEAEIRHLPLLNLHLVVANYTEEGQSTIHHRESLNERYQIMCHHYGKIPTIFMHLWFAVRQIIK
ncbi:MAG: glycosyltransferase family 2 protein [Prevotellaceae bacterium]|jgi:glycosyltransferase involved in cell wall biosynthesis|nr:glycosyltransferase family 2 protein [Prevotellaceae bacterium]MDO5129558.1 glycosyltransferase family 2 protein [Prevotellaceae bacterium]